MHFGPIQADRAKLQHSRHFRKQENLHKQIFQFWQERASKRRQRIVIGMRIACNEAECY
jgi:hypothetical protein